jgi:hypothetical protein
MSAFVIAITTGAFVAPVVLAQEHPKQYQDVKPAPRDSANPRSQSAEMPRSPAIIPPPDTGDKSVIVPPRDNAAKTPVISPPGTSGDKDNGNKDNIEPK